MNRLPNSGNRNTSELRARFAYLFMSIVDEPFLALYVLLLFILKKDLGASTFQIAFLVSLKPVLAVFSFYWSSNLKRRSDKLVTNLMGAWVLGRIGFFCFPLLDNVWFVIFAAGFYELFARASVPAMMEILKLNLSKPKRETLVSWVYVFKFIESALLAVFLGKLLDLNSSMWKILFGVSALLSLSSLLVQRKIIIPSQSAPSPIPQGVNRIIQPWKDSFALLRQRPDFARFQLGFMIGGFGLMMMVPASITFFADVLFLSHEQVSYARYIWMGLGVCLSSYYWRKALSTHSIDRLMILMLIGFTAFPFALFFASWSVAFLYLSFLFYGIAQAGSHLLWNLSGTYFARQEESAKYSTVNLHMIGIRGMIAPAFGAFLSVYMGASIVLLVGGVVCLIGAFYIYKTSTELVLEKNTK